MKKRNKSYIPFIIRILDGVFGLILIFILGDFLDGYFENVLFYGLPQIIIHLILLIVGVFTIIVFDYLLKLVLHCQKD